ncbi:hypothetical protein JCM17823_14060 [Halorubrum gandharaense]
MLRRGRDTLAQRLVEDWLGSEERTDHFVETLQQIMGRDRFDRNVRLPDNIRYPVKASFDPFTRRGRPLTSGDSRDRASHA